MSTVRTISTIAELEALYGAPGASSTVKEVDHLTDLHRKYVEASPFVVVATATVAVPEALVVDWLPFVAVEPATVPVPLAVDVALLPVEATELAMALFDAVAVA